MASPKEMLSALLTRGQLKPAQKEAFESMWDGVHRYGRLTAKQKAWVEREFYGQQLDRSNKPTPRRVTVEAKRPGSGTYAAVRPNKPSKKHYRIAYINYSGTRETLMVTNMAKLQELCPNIKPGTAQYEKIEAFFRKGGEVLKIKPSVEAKSA